MLESLRYEMDLNIWKLDKSWNFRTIILPGNLEEYFCPPRNLYCLLSLKYGIWRKKKREVATKLTKKKRFKDENFFLDFTVATPCFIMLKYGSSRKIEFATQLVQKKRKDLDEKKTYPKNKSVF